jgi:hypothetical protein
MRKQTAVEWLLQRFEDGDMYNVEDAQFIKHQALALEKEQIVDANISGMEFIPVDPSMYKEDAEQYYNETYIGGQDERNT